jgi:hypothetical protein
LKIRVKHFDTYVSSSFDDVLKSRNQDIYEKEEKLRNLKMHEAVIPMSFLDRVIMDDDYYSLKHLKF